jgi:hypothetical protein
VFFLKAKETTWLVVKPYVLAVEKLAKLVRHEQPRLAEDKVADPSDDAKQIEVTVHLEQPCLGPLTQ